MPQWLPPLAAAAFAVLLLNIALIVQRVRERSKSWPAQFLRDLWDWDGRLPHEQVRIIDSGEDIHSSCLAVPLLGLSPMHSCRDHRELS